MLKIYPEILPLSLSEFPALLKGKVAHAAEMLLASKCDYDGARACEMASALLDEEMVSEDTPYSFDERMAILRCAHQLGDWSVGTGSEDANDPVIREKIGFVINLSISYAQRDKSNYWRYMNEAAQCARYLARVYRERLDSEEAASSEEVCMAEGV